MKFWGKNSYSNYSLNKNPNPIFRNSFFSNFQKKANWPKRNPMLIKRTWYSGNIRISRIGVKKNPKSSLVIPSQMQTGFETIADAEPVIAKTIKIMVSWKLDWTPHRCFNFSIWIVLSVTKLSFLYKVKHKKKDAFLRHPSYFIFEKD